MKENHAQQIDGQEYHPQRERHQENPENQPPLTPPPSTVVTVGVP